MLKRVTLLLLICGLLNACVSLRPLSTIDKPHVIPWPQRQAVLRGVTHWRASGAVGIIDGQQGDSANVVWRQQGGNYHLQLSGPLGVGATRISGQPGQVRLVTNQGKVIRATTPEDLVYRATGWYLPVRYLQAWILGLPALHLAAKPQFDVYGRLRQLQQAGWTIHFLAYENFKGFDLPVRLRLTRDDLRVTLVVKQWQVYL